MRDVSIDLERKRKSQREWVRAKRRTNPEYREAERRRHSEYRANMTPEERWRVLDYDLKRNMTPGRQSAQIGYAIRSRLRAAGLLKEDSGAWSWSTAEATAEPEE
jgi:hypothetical protein